MPTKKPSLHIVVDQDIADLYKRAAKAQNRSVSSLIGEIIVEVAPHIETITKVLESAQGLPKETLNRIAAEFGEGTEQIQQSYLTASSHLDLILESVKNSSSGA